MGVWRFCIAASDVRRAAGSARDGVRVRSGLCMTSATAAVAALLLSTTGCERARPTSGPRLVVLYAPCTVSKQFLSPYNPTVRFTPHLQNFAKRSLVFERHQTESGQSGTAYASIFSGTQATRHGIFSHPNRIADDVPLLTDAFARAGWDVHAWMGHQMANAALGYARGTGEGQSVRGALRADRPDFAKILERLREDPDYRALVVTNFTVTHGPYRGAWLDDFCGAFPDQCLARNDRAAFDRSMATYRQNMRALGWDHNATRRRLNLGRREMRAIAAAVETTYASTVFHLDRLFGAIVEAIDESGLIGESLIAFTADHGEILYRDNALLYWTHGFQLAPEVLGVPWILFGPAAGVRAGRYEGVTRSIDIMPTLSALAGVTIDRDAEHGANLAAATRGRVEPPPLLAFSHTPLYQQRYWNRFRRYSEIAALFPTQTPERTWVAVRDGDLVMKLRARNGKRWETPVYDLATDPAETIDIFNAADRRHQELLRRLHAYKARIVEQARNAESTVPAKRSVELLRELGYID